MNYAIVYLGGILFFALGYWFVRGRKFYTGPLIEADVHEDSGSDSNGPFSELDTKEARLDGHRKPHELDAPHGVSETV